MRKNFNQLVWNALKKIPHGRVSTYKEIARAVGHPQACRAVGNACNKNPFSPRVPCHRVVKSDASIGGYAQGKKKKIAFLEREGIQVKKGKILEFKTKFYGFQ